MVERRTLTVLSAVSILGAVEGLQGYGVSLLTPEIAASVEVGAISLVTARLLALLLGAMLPIVVPTISASRRDVVRVWVCRVAGLVCALSLTATGKVTSTSALIVVLCVTAVASAPSRAMHRSMLLGAVPTDPVRALRWLQAAALAAQLALALGLATGAGWRHVVEIVGGTALLAVIVVSTLLRPPAEGGSEASTNGQSWQEIARSWRATPGLVGTGVALLAIGMLAVPFEAVFSIYLHSRWRLGLSGTAVVFSIVAAVSLAAVLLGVRRSSHSWSLLAAGGGLLVVGASVPDRAVMVVAVALGSGLVASLVPTLGGAALAAVSPHQRPEMSAAIASALPAGGLIGIITATSFADRHGARSALIALAVVALIASLVLRVTGVPSAVIVPPLGIDTGDVGASHLLDCSGVDFAYGRLQVLFDVGLTIDEGEIVALLGTNGAGKSTLLNVISGLGLPQRGSIFLGGRDITFLDAEARVRLGITQVPGGRAVFGSMSVVENLQCYGYTLGRDRQRIDEAVERCLDAFPALGQRRSSLAATLSGGEQQMLGLSKALILRPKLLLIDELTLGLAPLVVAPLLDLVRRINADGTSVVIVEQSVNVALSLVDRAYFMEKGAVRFDGPARELLDRHDLLRAVFLEGAAKTAFT